MNRRSGRFFRSFPAMRGGAVALFLLTAVAIGRSDEGDAPTRVVRNVAYRDDADADPVRHKLDLYLPPQAKSCPVIFFVHGGAWIMGDKNQLGIYEKLGGALAKRGIGAVSTNYRLSPGVKHPEHVKDVARAFAWTHRNIAKFGGDPNRLFVCGHSAGAHLIALLATDESYLKAEGLSLTAIGGAIPISGLLALPPDLLPGVFGRDPAIRKAASPIHHVRAGLPPFLVLFAENDLSVCAKTSAEFADALKAKEGRVEKREMKKRTHLSIVTKAHEDGDPVLTELVRFVTAPKRP